MMEFDASYIWKSFTAKRRIGPDTGPITNSDSHGILYRHSRLDPRAQQRSQHQQRRDARRRYSDIHFHGSHQLISFY